MKTTVVLSFLGLLLLTAQPSQAQTEIGASYIQSRDIIYRGIKEFVDEDYDAAIRLFAKVQEGDSLYELSLYEMMLSQIANKQYAQALENAEKGLHLSKAFRKDFLLQKGNTLELMEMSDSAIKIYDIGISEFPNIYNWYYEKGVTYIKRKEWEKGLDNLEKALLINPNHRGSHIQIGLLAASSDRPALALLTLQYALLQNATDESALNLVNTMQEIAGGEFEPSKEHIAPASLFAGVTGLEDLDDLIRSKTALSEGFKPSIKLKFNITRQVQLLIQQLPSDAESTRPIFQRYISFFQQVKRENEYPQMMLYSLSNVGDPSIQKQVKKNKSKVLAYQEKFLRRSRESYQKIDLLIDGKKQTMVCHYDEGKLIAAGDFSAEGTKEGQWYFFHDNGYLSARGKFLQDKKEGEWMYYYKDGIMSSIENFSNGVLDGYYVDFVENGEKKVEATYQKGKLVNELVFYWANGVVKEKIPLKNEERTGLYMAFHPNGVKATEYPMKKGAGEGTYTSWHKSGAVNIQGEVKNDYFHNDFVSFHENGQIYARGKYANGDREGEWTYYYESGKKMEEGTWKKGKRVGLWKQWYENGNLSSEDNYADGELDGEEKEYDEAGKILYIHTYKKGDLVSVSVYDASGKEIDKRIDQNGTIQMVYHDVLRQKSAEGMLVNGMREGQWRFFYPSGQVSSSENYEKGLVQGKVMTYYENGKLKSEYFYENNEREGFGRSYHVNGEVQSEGYWKAGSRFGPWKYYDIGNNLTGTEFYYNGEIYGMDRDYYPNGKPLSETLYKCYWIDNFNFFDTSGYEYSKADFVSGDGTFERKTINGAITYKAPYKDHHRHGACEGFYINGRKKSVFMYENGEATGLATWYYLNGKKEVEGHYKGDERDSTWTWYFPNGKVEELANFKDGERHGTVKFYNDQGKLVSERDYVKGKRHGITTTYNDNGEPLFRLYHYYDQLTHYSYQGKDGKWLDSIAIPASGEHKIITYFPSGAKASSFSVKDGYYQGEDVQYFANGKPYKQYTNEGNSINGNYKKWYANGNLHEDENYLHGQFHGKCVYYHRNGKIAMEVNYLYGEKHGVENLYDENGKLLLSTNYYYGQEL